MTWWRGGINSEWGLDRAFTVFDDHTQKESDEPQKTIETLQNFFQASSLLPGQLFSAGFVPEKVSCNEEDFYFFAAIKRFNNIS